MRLGKNKAPTEQGRQRTPRYTPQQSGTAFSYYNSRNPETPNRQARVERQLATQQAGGKHHRSRIPLAQLPFWLLIIVVSVCVMKLLALSTDPKVVLLGQSKTTAAYTHTAHTYEVAAQKLLAGSILNYTKLTVNSSGTARSLEAEFPEIQAASVTLPLAGNRLIVYMQVAQPSAVLETAGGDVALNKSGLALAKLNSLPVGVPIIVDQSHVVATVGKQVLPSGTVSFVQTVAYQFAAAKQPVVNFVLPASSPYEVDMRLEGKSYIVRFNLQASSLQQSGAAIATLQRPDVAPGSYIDVRVPERVYYK